MSLEQLPRTRLQVWAVNWDPNVEEGKEQGANTMFSFWMSSHSDLSHLLFPKGNQIWLYHFIDEELELRCQKVKGPAKHSWRWWGLDLNSGFCFLFPRNHGVTGQDSGGWILEADPKRAKEYFYLVQTMRATLVNFQLYSASPWGASVMK